MPESEPTPISLNKNPSSIYYIHPSDSNSTQIVSVRFNEK